jgi:ATP-binding cassette subfamily C protein
MEVFYAHTIAPVSIAVITSAIYIAIFARIHALFALSASVCYLLLGFLFPVFFKRSSEKHADAYRKSLGDSSSYILDSLRGLNEIIFFNEGGRIKQAIKERFARMNESGRQVRRREGVGLAFADLVIVLFLFLFISLGYLLLQEDAINPSNLIVGIVLFMSSFGPVMALSGLSTTLAGSIASAGRVFDLLDESPMTHDVHGGQVLKGSNIDLDHVRFQYNQRDVEVLKDLSMKVESGERLAVMGESGCGKSTLLKLMMRFYDIDNGKLSIGANSISEINTDSLRDFQCFVAQDTFLSNDTIENNIRMENDSASFEDVERACRKASIHDFIIGLPDGYNTRVGELGDRLASGERQRIALARAFLTERRILLMDEPTSNLDSLNEAHILRSIQENSGSDTVVLVSHKKSVSNICDRVLVLEDGQIRNDAG